MEDERTGSEDADASGAEVTGIVGDANGGAEGGAAGVAERGGAAADEGAAAEEGVSVDASVTVDEDAAGGAEGLVEGGAVKTI